MSVGGLRARVGGAVGPRRVPVRTDDEREPIPFSEEASDSDGVLFSPTTWAAVATPLSACGRPAAISGLRRWNSEKVIG